jgi:hypothetical protein
VCLVTAVRAADMSVEIRRELKGGICGVLYSGSWMCFIYESAGDRSRRVAVLVRLIQYAVLRLAMRGRLGGVLLRSRAEFSPIGYNIRLFGLG